MTLIIDNTLSVDGNINVHINNQLSINSGCKGYIGPDGVITGQGTMIISQPASGYGLVSTHPNATINLNNLKIRIDEAQEGALFSPGNYSPSGFQIYQQATGGTSLFYFNNGKYVFDCPSGFEITSTGSNATVGLYPATNLEIKADLTFVKNNDDLTVVMATGNPRLAIHGDVNVRSDGIGNFIWTTGNGTIEFMGPRPQSINFDGQTVDRIIVNKNHNDDTIIRTQQQAGVWRGISGYDNAVSGATLPGGGQYGVEYMNLGNNGMSSSHGTVYEVEYYLNEPNIIADYFYVTFWRQNDDLTYNRVGKTENLISHTITSGINRIALDTPVQNINIGDHIGCFYNGTGNVFKEYQFFNGSGDAQSVVGVSGGVTALNGFDWSNDYDIQYNNGGLGATLLLKAYMKSPDIVCIGDGFTAGFPLSASNHDNINLYLDSGNYVRLLRDNINQNGFMITNEGMSGNSAGDIYARFDRDVINVKPITCITWAMHNNSSDTYTTISGHFQNIVNDCVSNNIIPVFLESSPMPGRATGEWMRYETGIEAVAQSILSNTSYGTYISGIRSNIGQVRNSATGIKLDNLWDYQAVYSGTDIYPNPLGYSKIADVVYSGLLNAGLI